MRTHQKITVGIINATIFERFDLILLDANGEKWQLIHFFGYEPLHVFGDKVFAKWLLWHPNGGFKMRHIATNVPIYLDTLTEG